MSTSEKSIFDNHYKYAAAVPIDNLKKDAGQNEQVSSDYQGRVLYELLQNAFDKAEKNILVQVRDNFLIVANDGKQFTYNSNHDYLKGETDTDNFIRYDFQSICSSSNSNKNANENIGNKGVGFKSVYSIAEYANIYTKGIVYNNNQEVERIPISFRLYGKFQDKDKVPSDFEPNVQKNIKSQVEAIQREKNFITRGLPGYYYPLRISNEPDFVKELFERGYVTIIELPFFNKEIVDNLFNEIKQVHFNFIELKYSNDFQITFDNEGDIFTKKSHIGNNSIFTTKIVNDNLRTLANKANIHIKEPQIAIFFKDSEVGKFYNYLPTEKESPFKYVDFHADFHTKVDRKNIDFNESTTIGEYNKALLDACIELYFVVINNYLEKNDRIKLNLKYLDNNLNFKLNEFNWNYLAFSNEKSIMKSAIIRILNMEYENYETVSLLISRIARKFFYNTEESDGEKERLFFDNILSFIVLFVDDYYRKDGYRPSQKFKDCLAKKLIETESKIIPNVCLQKGTEIIYKKEDAYNLPDGINITKFEIQDQYLQSCLGIKKFTDYDEIIKYYKQCKFDGYTFKNNTTISEEDQIKLLKSLVELLTSKSIVLSTHRFTKAYNRSLRESSNSANNQANFNVSTLFLKITTGNYKPAQLCTKNELDQKFLRSFVNEANEELVLKFLGVSFDSNYIFADKRLYEKLNDGLEYLPLISRKDFNEDINEELIENFCVIATKNKEVLHPAIINRYESYKFLHKISSKNIKEDLKNLLINRYDEYPTIYKKILKNHINDNITFEKEIVRLYQSLFNNFAKDNEFLIIENNTLCWTQNNDFLILNTKEDYELCKKLENKKVLCFYSGFNIVPEALKKYCIESRKGEITYSICNNPSDVLLELISILPQKIIYILISISNASDEISNLNYLDVRVDLTSLQKRVCGLEIKEVDNLKQIVNFANSDIVTEPVYAFNKDRDGNLFINQTASKKQIAEAVSSYLFGNTSITETVELILFYKEIDLLKQEYSEEDITIISQRWLPDYESKFKEFMSEILSAFPEYEVKDEKWYLYNRNHKSELLITLFNSGHLAELQSRIVDCKKNYKDYFENFKEEIDQKEIFSLAAKLLNFLQTDQQVHKELINRVNELSLKLGTEEEFKSIQRELSEKYPAFNEQKIDQEKIKEKEKEIDIENRINYILNSFPSLNKQKKITNSDLNGNSSAIPCPKKIKTLKFYSNSGEGSQGIDLEVTGAIGEIEVLYFLIEQFLKLNINHRITGLDAVCDLLKKKTSKSFENQKQAVLEVIGVDLLLKRALIPLFYITLHNKYLPVDLIGFLNGKASFFEIKTTKYNSDRFFMSISEVQVARDYKEQYEIIRVSDKEINFIGNPIYDLERKGEEKLTEIKSDLFILKPRNFEFIFVKLN